MSFAVTVVVDIDDGPAEDGWLTGLRERFADISAVVRASAAGSADGAVAHAEVPQNSAIAQAQYVWFLPAGTDPADGSLAALIEALNTAESLGAVGPKMLIGSAEDDSHELDESRELVSAGVTTTAEGLRVNSIAPGETDEGQYDRREDALAVDAPGLLARAEAVAAVGIPSSVLSPAYRGIEYSRRVRAAGYRVGLVPAAAVRIPAAAAEDYRSSARPLNHPQALREEHRYRLAVAQRSQVGWTALRLFGAALLAGLGNLLSNDPRRALWCLRSAAALPADLRATAALRRTRSGRDAAALMFANRRELDVIRRELRSAVADKHPADKHPADERPTGKHLAGRQAAGVGDAGADAAGGAAHERTGAALNTSGEVAGYSGIDVRSRRSLIFHPLVAVLFVTLLGSALLLYPLAGPGAVAGGALPRFDVSYGALLDRILVPVSELGLGSVTAADPVLSVFAVLGLLFFGDLDLMITVLWFAALPLAALVMYLCAGRIAPPAGIRGVLALIWACSPAFLLALVEGRYGTVLAWLCAPAACWALERAIRLRRATAAAAAGLALAVVLAGSPFLVVPVLLGLCVMLIIMRRPSLLWAILPSLGLLGPWLLGAARHLDVFLANPGRVFEYTTPTSYQLALGYPARPRFPVLEALLPAGVTPWVLLALMLPLVLAGALALTRVTNSLPLLLVSAALYCFGLAGGIAQAALEAGLTADGLVASYTGDSLLLMGLGAVGFLACALWPLSFDTASRLRSLSLRCLVPLTALILLTLFVAHSLTSGLVLQRSTAEVLPAFAAERSSGPLGQRTLILGDRGGQLHGALASESSGTVLETSTLHEAASIDGGPFERRPVAIDEADTALATTIGRLTAGDGADARDGLRELGIGFVVVAPDSAESLSRVISVSPGLTRLGDTDQGHLWQVATDAAPIAYASLVSEDTTVEAVELSDGMAQIPAGEPERRLVLAERSGITRAEIAGSELPTLEDGWQAAYAVPAEGGELHLSSRRPAHSALVIGGLVIVFLAGLAAIPFGGTASPTGGCRGGGRGWD